MSVLLFRLTGVPDDEAEEVRALLDSQGFDTYETSAGRWQIGVAAIWLANETQADAARAVLADYQARRHQQAKLNWEEQRAANQHNTFWRNLARQPGRVIVLALGGVVILALSVVPFLRFMVPT